jgi:hypothetical protein
MCPEAMQRLKYIMERHVGQLSSDWPRITFDEKPIVGASVGASAGPHDRAEMALRDAVYRCPEG